MAKLKYKVGDEVVVRSGALKGKTGKISQVHPRDEKVTIDGLNVVKRHRKQSQSTPTAGVYEISMPIHISKIGINDDGKNTKPAKIGYKIDSKGVKTRVYSTTSKEIK
jgi:large subunit ribosomal protein L24